MYGLGGCYRQTGRGKNMISRWNSINFEVGKKILASDYARQLRFPANFGFYILADKLTILIPVGVKSCESK